MPKMFIPEIGTDITLNENWTFDLIYEKRNSELLVRSGFIKSQPTYRSYYYCDWADITYPPSLHYLIYVINEAVKNNDFNNPEFSKPTTPIATITVKSNLAKLNGPTKSVYRRKVFTVGNITFDIEGEFGPFETVIPKGTILKIDRIYIRKGMSDYSSVSFIVEDSPDVRLLNKKKASKLNVPCEKPYVRFFAKLEDVNNLEFV